MSQKRISGQRARSNLGEKIHIFNSNVSFLHIVVLSFCIELLREKNILHCDDNNPGSNLLNYKIRFKKFSL